MTEFSLKAGKRIYAIGDIHGYIDALEEMQNLILEDIERSKLNLEEHDIKIIYLGDYVDRGPHSYEVLENLAAESKKQDGIERIFIRGNHDIVLQRFGVKDLYDDCSIWLKYGGIEMLRSYGVEAHENMRPAEIELAGKQFVRALPDEHRQFVDSLKLFHVEDDFLFAHAGVDPHRPILEQDERTYTFIREPFLSWEGILEKKIIHGHTISVEPDVKGHRIGIDVGVYENARLGCVVLEEGTHRFLFSSTELDVFDDPKL